MMDSPQVFLMIAADLIADLKNRIKDKKITFNFLGFYNIIDEQNNILSYLQPVSSNNYDSIITNLSSEINIKNSI